MTNTEIIQAIRNEIERLKEHAAKCGYPGQDEFADGNREGRNFICDKLLSFLSTLEESEKPMELDDLMKEAQRYYSDNFAYLSSDQPTLSILTNIARHFAQWGAEHLKK